MGMWLVLVGAALAEPPKHIEVPDPGEGEGMAPLVEDPTAAPPEPEAPPVATATPIPAASAPSRPRSAARKVEGSAPANVYGRYRVAEVTEAGETEGFKLKMERAGRALNEDCIVVHLGFNFGPPPAEGADGHRPPSVEISQIQQCDKGGLGKYAQELSVELPATWGKAENALTLELPAATVMSDYVRLRRPADGDMRTPPQWLAPDTRIERPVSSYQLVAEPGRRKDDMPVLHLRAGDVTLHLEADPLDGPFNTGK